MNSPPPPSPESSDELGAHVSAAGGVDRSPARAREIGARVLQLFTKQPNRWAEREVEPALAEAFGEAREDQGIRVAGSHDSYLINLASPDPDLWERSRASFEAELRRAVTLGLDFVVTHPGNATDGDHASGLARNAEGIGRVLEAVPGPTAVLLEITAGSGTSVGGRLDDLAILRAGVPDEHRERVGICFDTCHALAAGYDLVEDYEGVMAEVDDVVGIDRIGLFHLNDSLHPLGSRKDRHAHIGEGHLGLEPFRRLLRDPRFREVPKVLETPKGDDVVASDRKNLATLRGLRDPGSGGP
jgi:deoxyribonuclease-4